VAVRRRIVVHAGDGEEDGATSNELGVQLEDARAQRRDLIADRRRSRFRREIRTHVRLRRRKPRSLSVGQDLFSVRLVRFQAERLRELPVEKLPAVPVATLGIDAARNVADIGQQVRL